MVESKGRIAGRNGHQYMIPADDVGTHTRLLYVVLGGRLNMVPQTIVGVVFVLVECIDESRAVFRPQILGAERRVCTEENLRVQIGSTRAAKTHTHAL